MSRRDATVSGPLLVEVPLPRFRRKSAVLPPGVPRPLPGLPFPSRLDAPRTGHPAPAHSILVRGWIAVRERSRLGQPVIVAGPRRLETQAEPRSEVLLGRRNRQLLGFRRFVLLEDEPAMLDVPWELEVTVDGKSHRAPLDITPSSAALVEFQQTKARKLEQLEPLLRCPRVVDERPDAPPCGGALKRSLDRLRCERCGAVFSATGGHFDLLDDSLRELAAIEDTDNVSSWGYDPFAEKIIERGGLVLDVGSGFKGMAYEHVINLEIVDYPSTDVLGVAESLPFADATFDGALSLAVFEHVRDPFRAARELARVVRPGGVVYVAVPFLQPYHGFPHHYYNMTLAGLENLLDGWFRIDESGTPPYGWPVWTLTWFLNSYLAGLPTDTARRFKEMKVADLLEAGDRYLGDDFVQHLSPDAITELASVNYVIGTRR